MKDIIYEKDRWVLISFDSSRRIETRKAQIIGHHTGGVRPSQRNEDTRTYCVDICYPNSTEFHYEDYIDEKMIVGYIHDL